MSMSYWGDIVERNIESLEETLLIYGYRDTIN